MFIEFSNGVKLSEETVKDALKRQGINVDIRSAKPKHIFETGDVVRNEDGFLRIIVGVHGKLYSFNENGIHQSTGQASFESFGYQFIGKLKNMLK